MCAVVLVLILSVLVLVHVRMYGFLIPSLPVPPSRTSPKQAPPSGLCCVLPLPTPPCHGTVDEAPSQWRHKACRSTSAALRPRARSPSPSRARARSRGVPPGRPRARRALALARCDSLEAALVRIAGAVCLGELVLASGLLLPRCMRCGAVQTSPLWKHFCPTPPPLISSSPSWKAADAIVNARLSCASKFRQLTQEMCRTTGMPCQCPSGVSPTVWTTLLAVVPLGPLVPIFLNCLPTRFNNGAHRATKRARSTRKHCTRSPCVPDTCRPWGLLFPTCAQPPERAWCAVLFPLRRSGHRSRGRVGIVLR